ncbi:hypothetical protein [Streptomyces sp. NPDC048338]
MLSELADVTHLRSGRPTSLSAGALRAARQAREASDPPPPGT